MAIAQTSVIVDGYMYKPGEEIPDLGSLVAKDTSKKLREYSGLYSDRFKLPKYNDLVTGSDATLVDEGQVYYFIYVAETKQWHGNGEVI